MPSGARMIKCHVDPEVMYEVDIYKGQTADESAVQQMLLFHKFQRYTIIIIYKDEIEYTR